MQKKGRRNADRTHGNQQNALREQLLHSEDPLREILIGLLSISFMSDSKIYQQTHVHKNSGLL